MSCLDWRVKSTPSSDIGPPSIWGTCYVDIWGVWEGVNLCATVQGDRQTNQTSFPGSDLHVVSTDVGDGDHLLLHLLRLGLHQLLRARGWVQVLRHRGQGAGRGEKFALLMFFFSTLIITTFKSLLVIFPQANCSVSRCNLLTPPFCPISTAPTTKTTETRGALKSGSKHNGNITQLSRPQRPGGPEE